MSRAEYSREYYRKNREILLEKQRLRDANRADEKRAYCREYHVVNKEALADKKRAYREATAEHRKAKMREWYEKNREYAIAKAKEYRDANKSTLNKLSNQYKTTRSSVDPLFKFKRCLRTLIYAKIRQGGYTKKSKTFTILGCTFDEFQQHISAQFTEGMSWSNHGEWHLDHITPVAVATTEEDVIRLNHYTNFRPLWAVDNLRKGPRCE